MAGSEKTATDCQQRNGCRISGNFRAFECSAEKNQYVFRANRKTTDGYKSFARQNSHRKPRCGRQFDFGDRARRQSGFFDNQRQRPFGHFRKRQKEIQVSDCFAD